MDKKTDDFLNNKEPSKQSGSVYGMSKSTISFLNAMTIVGYVFVGVILFISLCLVIMYWAGYFKDGTEPLVGLQFTAEEALVINGNGESGTIRMKVVSSDANFSYGDNGEIIVDDNAIPEEIKLTVRDANNNIINNIISVPESVMLGQYFDITPILAEDGYNAGGVCYIYAETMNKLYRVETPLEVRVDVPVVSIDIVATDPNTGETFDLTTANFVYDDKVQLSVKVTPERAISAYNQDLLKNVTYGVDFTWKATVDASTGYLTVTYNPTFTSNEPMVNPYEYAHITAVMDKYYTNSNETLTAECDLRLFPLQLSEIVIRNEDYADTDPNDEIEPPAISTQLFANDPLKISAVNTGVDGVINLDLFLRPTIYNPDNNDNPLSNLLSNYRIRAVYNAGVTEDGSIILEESTALRIEQRFVPGQENLYYYEITPLRELAPDEVVYLAINIDGYSDTLTILRELNIYSTTPDTLTFVDENNNDKVITELSMEITKYDTNPDRNQYAISNISYVTTGDEDVSYNKVVFFLSGTSTNINVTGSAVIAVNQYRQIFADGTVLPYNTIRALGAGSVGIVPYIVRTNESGQAIDVNNQVIADGSATGFRMVSNIENALPGEYIVERSYNELTVNVVELLADFTIYRDANLLQEVVTDSQNPLVMGTTSMNKLTLYAKPNSALALPTNAEYTRWSLTYGDIEFSENETNYFEKPNLDGGSGFSTGVEFVESGSGATYVRYMSFILRAPEAVTIGAVNINYNFDASGNSRMETIYLAATDIPVASIEIDTDGTTIINVRDYAGLKTWEFTTELSDDFITYNGTNYVRVNWTDSDGNIIVVPDASYGTTDEFAGFVPSNVQKTVEFYIFDTSTEYLVNGENLTVKQIFSNAYSLNESDSLYSVYWDFIKNNLLLQTNRADNSTDLDNFYIQTITVIIEQPSYNTYQTIQFIKELPENHEIFMFFRPSVDGVTSTIDEVKPAMVMLNFDWPSAAWTESTPVDDNIEPVDGYYVLDADTTQIEFSLNDLLKTNITGNYGLTNTQVDNDYEIEITVPQGQNNYLQYELTEDETSGEITNFIFKIRDSSALLTNTSYTVTITKSVGIAYSCRWTDELWQEAVLDSSSIDYNYLVNTSQVFTTTQTMQFVIRSTT